MAVLSPTVVGQVYQVNVQFSSTNAWLNHLPAIDGTAASVDFNDNHKTNALQCFFDYTLSNQTVAEARHTFLSFDVSSITDAASATISMYGHTNSQTGDPSGHSTDGIVIVGLSSALGSTTSLATSDWGALDNGASQPPLLSDVLTSWNTGTSTPNVFTFNSTGLNLINTTDTLQISICHKFWYDFAVTTHPFAFGNNAPDGSNGFGVTAGAYYGMGDDDTYKPFMTTTDPVTTGPVKIEGNFKITSGKFFIGES